jgi:ParB family chromosome partitioning protein
MTKKKKTSKIVLGKGLSALIPQKNVPHSADTDGSQSSRAVQLLDTSRIKADKAQPRVIFEQDRLEELCQSIKHHGVIQPILVRPDGDSFQIIFGERRYRAVKMLGMKTIPAIVEKAPAKKAHILALIENIQRENLNPIEEAEAYRKIMKENRMTQENLAAQMGKSRSGVANILRLLKLPSAVQNLLIQRKLSMGHVRCLLGVSSSEKQYTLAVQAVEEGWSVRELEQKVSMPEPSVDKSPVSAKPRKNGANDSQDPDIKRFVDKIQEKFCCRVRLKGGPDRGSVSLEFASRDELHRILELLDVVER